MIAKNISNLEHYLVWSIRAIVSSDSPRRISSLSIWASISLGLSWNPESHKWGYFIHKVEGPGQSCLWVNKGAGDSDPQRSVDSIATATAAALDNHIHTCLDLEGYLRPSVEQKWWFKDGM